jgi:3-methyladenine DNA glycosylase/8-oxoguanine DNA glycosylase
VGAQAAALLDAAYDGAVLGEADPFDECDGEVRLARPRGYDLGRTALSHGGAGLAPTGWDGARLLLRLPDRVVVDADLRVTWVGTAPDVDVLRRVLALDDDVEPLWAACDAVPELVWVRTRGAGRFLRSPTAWQDVVGALAQVRSSYRGAQARMRSLSRGGPFPSPGDVARRGALPGWGLREPWVLHLARAVDGGRLDPERWLSAELADDDVHAELLAVDGVGPFTAAQLMPLLGRPRPMVLDGWLRAALGGADDAELHRRFAGAGRWAGTAAWLAALRPRLARDPRG